MIYSALPGLSASLFRAAKALRGSIGPSENVRTRQKLKSEAKVRQLKGGVYLLGPLASSDVELSKSD